MARPPLPTSLWANPRGDESRLKALLSSKRCCVCLAKKPVDTVAPAPAPTVDEADLE